MIDKTTQDFQHRDSEYRDLSPTTFATQNRSIRRRPPKSTPRERLRRSAVLLSNHLFQSQVALDGMSTPGLGYPFSPASSYHGTDSRPDYRVAPPSPDYSSSLSQAGDSREVFTPPSSPESPRQSTNRQKPFLDDNSPVAEDDIVETVLQVGVGSPLTEVEYADGTRDGQTCFFDSECRLTDPYGNVLVQEPSHHKEELQATQHDQRSLQERRAYRHAGSNHLDVYDEDRDSAAEARGEDTRLMLRQKDVSRARMADHREQDTREPYDEIEVIYDDEASNIQHQPRERQDHVYDTPVRSRGPGTKTSHPRRIRSPREPNRLYTHARRTISPAQSHSSLDSYTSDDSQYAPSPYTGRRKKIDRSQESEQRSPSPDRRLRPYSGNTGKSPDLSVSRFEGERMAAVDHNRSPDRSLRPLREDWIHRESRSRSTSPALSNVDTRRERHRRSASIESLSRHQNAEPRVRRSLAITDLDSSDSSESDESWRKRYRGPKYTMDHTLHPLALSRIRRGAVSEKLASERDELLDLAFDIMQSRRAGSAATLVVIMGP